jgi:hypothetical protein
MLVRSPVQQTIPRFPSSLGKRGSPLAGRFPAWEMSRPFLFLRLLAPERAEFVTKELDLCPFKHGGALD